MSLALIDEVLLRILSDPTYTAKGSPLTWTELDTDLKILADAIKELAAVPDAGGGFDEYDNAETYEDGDYVSYTGNIWKYIGATPDSGVTPGTDPTKWEISSVGQFSHEKNKDQYLDFGGTYQVSAADIYSKINETEGLEFTLWDSGTVYVSGNTVIYGEIIWRATGTTTAGSAPGGGGPWTFVHLNNDAYGISWLAELQPPSSDKVYLKFESIISDLEDFYKLDGSLPLEGDMDADGNDIENVFYLEASGIHIGNGVKILDPLGATQYMEIVPSGANASYLLARPDSSYIASADFINGTNTSSGFSLEYRMDNFNIYDRAAAINRLQVNTDGNFGINGNDPQGGEGVAFIFNAATEPTGVSSSGAIFWAFNDILKTNTDFAIDNSSKGPILKSSIDGHYYKYTAGVAGALVITDLGTSI